MTDEELHDILAEAREGGESMICMLPTAMADIVTDALRFRHLRRTVEKNREGLLQADFAVMYPDEWTTNVEDMREMWTAAIDRNMKGKLP
jgi:hypothetical protein